VDHNSGKYNVYGLSILINNLIAYRLLNTYRTTSSATPLHRSILINSISISSLSLTLTVCDVINSVFFITDLAPHTGFVYTQTSDRLWRKNRQAAPSGSTCIGLDLNRYVSIIFLHKFLYSSCAETSITNGRSQAEHRPVPVRKHIRVQYYVVLSQIFSNLHGQVSLPAQLPKSQPSRSSLFPRVSRLSVQGCLSTSTPTEIIS
jgi:hypothetical protein